eukprot:5146629-Pyramimonas_sp.AAC.1
MFHNRNNAGSHLTDYVGNVAGLQAMTAAKLLEVLPGNSLLDPFMGGGCTLIEGLRSGRAVIGSDISPLAAFVSFYHTWQPSATQLQGLQTLVKSILNSASYDM